jgi:hypothetical protein
MSEEEYFPNWLFEAIVEDYLPWELASDYSYEKFAEKYTLHDSLWVGLFANVTYEDTAILVFMWDSVWLPDEIAKTT